MKLYFPRAVSLYGLQRWSMARILVGCEQVSFRDGIKITDIHQMDSRYGRINYYISPKLLYEHTGYLWDGKTK